MAAGDRITVAQLKAEFDEFRKTVEDFLAGYGFFYTSNGTKLRMMITRIHPAGTVDGVVISPNSAGCTFDVWEIPMGKPKPGAQGWEPINIPKEARIELFGEEDPDEEEDDEDEPEAAQHGRRTAIIGK